MSYGTPTVGTWVTNTDGSALSPLAPASATGKLLLLVTACRAGSATMTSLATDWTELILNNTQGSLAVWGRIGDDTAADDPTVDWSATDDCAAVILMYNGDVYTDLATIVAHSGAASSSTGGLPLPVVSSVTTDGCLLFAVGRHNKTAASDGATIAHATLTMRASSVVNGVNQAIGIADLQQTTAADFDGTDMTCSISTDVLNSNGVVLYLQSDSAAPLFSVAPAVSSQTATVYTVGFTPSASGTVYGVAVGAGTAAPSVAQVKAGLNQAGTAAKAANNKAVTGVDTLTLTPSDAPVAATYDLYFVLSNAGGDSALATLAGEALDAPAFTVAATVTSQSASAYTVGFTPDAACTIYGVAVIAGSAAPSIAQIKLGQNGAGAAAKADNSKAVTGADSFTLTPSDSPAFPVYDLYCVLSGNTGDSARRTIAGEYLDAPTGKSFTTLTSVDSTSPFYGTGAAVGDTAVVDSVTTPDSYVITVAVDGTVEYAAGGDDSRQTAAADVYDYSAGAYLGAGTLVFNNLAPTVDGLVFDADLLYQKDVAIAPIALAALVTDPEGDTVTVTALDALPAGLAITSSELGGTPTAYGETVADFEWEDQYGATYVEAVTIQVGDLVPDVIGDDEATAEAAIVAVASLTTSVTTAASASVASGNVISTDPVAGTLVNYDAVIGVVVSSGSAITITTTTLTDGARDTAYYVALAASGTVTAWSLDAGDLPTGLTLDTSLGEISGTPTVAGSYAFTIGATNGAASDTQALTLTITGIAPTITTTSLTRAIEGEAYTAQLAATGDATITYAVTTGLLPAGLSLSSSGAITGTPTELGGNSFTVTATNSEGSDTQALGLSVVAASVGYVLTLKPLRNRINLRRRHDA